MTQAFVTRQYMCDITIGDVTMSSHRMTSRSTDERQQGISIGHRVLKTSPVAIPSEKRLHAKGEAKKCSSLQAYRKKLCDFTNFKKTQHKAKYRHQPP